MKFERDKTVTREEPLVEVDPPERPGIYRFRLVVEDRRGQSSTPAEWVVTVEKTP